jgi:hypothetical protein
MRRVGIRLPRRMRKRATFLPAQPSARAKTRLVPGNAAARFATRRRMSVTSADGRESVSAQCPATIVTFSPTPSLPRQALFPWPYGELRSEGRTPLVAFFASC